MTGASDDLLDDSDDTPRLQARLVVAACLTVIAAVYTWVQHRYFLAAGAAPDSIVVWRAARMLLDGGDPWNAAQWAAAGVRYAGTDVAWRMPMSEPLYYPLPAVVPWLPFATLSFLTASIVFNAIGTFAFAFTVTRIGLHRAWLCGSIPFFIALRFGQWSPLLCAALLVPSLGALLLAKPNLGAPMFLAAPTLPAVFGCVAFLVVPTVFVPWWGPEWWHNVTHEMGRATPHPAPIRMFGGWGALVLLGVLRWRRADARLLVGLACVPQLPYWADQLPLLLVARSRREVIGFVLVTLLGMMVWLSFFVGHGDPVDTMRPIAAICSYLPALLLILRRPNVGVLPPLLMQLRTWWAGARRTDTRVNERAR